MAVSAAASPSRPDLGREFELTEARSNLSELMRVLSHRTMHILDGTRRRVRINRNSELTGVELTRFYCTTLKAVFSKRLFLLPASLVPLISQWPLGLFQFRFLFYIPWSTVQGVTFLLFQYGLLIISYLTSCTKPRCLLHSHLMKNEN